MHARNLLRLLMVIALIFAPVAMMGGHAAMASPASVGTGEHHAMASGADGHCANMGEQDDGDLGSSIDCMVACAGMLPQAPVMATNHVLANAPARPLIVVAQHGLNPAAEPRPPRYS
jgi:hypothetical protein